MAGLRRRADGAFGAFFIAAVPAQNGEGFGSASVRFERDYRPAGLEFAFVILRFFLGNSHPDQCAGKSRGGGARGGAR